MSKTFNVISFPCQFVITNEGFRKSIDLSKSAKKLWFEIIKDTSWNNIYFNYEKKNKAIKELIDNNFIFTTEIKNKYKINNSLYHCYDPAEYYDENHNLYIRMLDDNEKEILVFIEKSEIDKIY